MGQTPSPTAPVVIGQLILDKYRIDAVLGQGGMGVVAACTHLALGERFAIKMLRQDVLMDRDAVERFTREAQAAAKLKSEYVARVHDSGVLENGTPFMVMEYLDGHDLGELIKERGHVAVPWATDLMLQTCEALTEAHGHGIIHRDVKPTNLFVTWRPDGTSLIKVLDFGISKVSMGTDMNLTQTQSLLGTPAYMSPEQMRSARDVDSRTDIWSLGTVMFELLEGRRPFEAESFSEMCVKVAVDAPAPMQNVPADLRDVVLRCLAKAPDQRYQTMAELAHDLVPFAQDPAAASRLVERMQRMVRRSATDWDHPTTNAGQRSVPTHVRDLDSAPNRIPGSDPAIGWARGAEPAGMFRTPIPTQAQRAATPPAGVPVGPTVNVGSAPARAVSQLGLPPRRRNWIAITAIATLLGTGVALGIVLASKHDAAPTTEAAVVEPTVDDPSGSAGPVATDPVGELAGTDPVVDVGSGSAPVAVEPVAVEPVAVEPEVKPAAGDAKPDNQTATRPKPKYTRPKYTRPKEPKPKEVAKPVVETPKPVKACDPFANPHGCKGKR